VSNVILQIGVLVSGHGRGTNLQAIIDACAHGEVNARVAVVIGNRDGAPALERARAAGVEAVVINPKDYESDDAYGEVLEDALCSRGVKLICLAGYMRLLPLNLVRRFEGHILNVHAALLPLFGGKGMYGIRVHEAVIASGMKVSGATVHVVNEIYDSGPILVQRTVPVLPGDTPETLAARILPEEHRAYVEAIRMFENE
jgi:formyltetrahydrofolate-dependent phosphoribosylglycinamide formyltransferase